MSAATVLEVRTARGVAGALCVSALVDHGDGPAWVSFFGSVYGGPIAMRTPGGVEVFVSSAVLDRCGRVLSADWVRSFFGPVEVEGGAR